MLDTTSFYTAHENMRYDETQFSLIQPDSNHLFFRFYTWQLPGLTQSEKRRLPKNLLPFDHAYRLTGGGIVFHCPGDIVFSHAAPIAHPLLPSKLKERCLWMAKSIQAGLMKAGIYTDLAADLPKPQSESNIMFCNSYHNPYECLLDNQKICGIALKKTRHSIIFQGSIHLHNTATYFPDIQDAYGSYFTRGCAHLSLPSTDSIISYIAQEFQNQYLLNDS